MNKTNTGHRGEPKGSILRWRYIIPMAAVLTSCASRKPIILPYDVTEVKTEYVTTYVHDTTIVKEKEIIEPKGDTLYITRTRTQYKEKVIYKDSIRVDTVPVQAPYPVEVEVPVEVPAKIGFIARFLMFCGGASIALLSLLLMVRIAKK